MPAAFIHTPRELVQRLVPQGLDLVTHDGYAFWNVVVSKIDNMRPRGLPRWTGVTYHHVAYRLQVGVETAAEERLQGLYFVRSDVDSRLIACAGDVLTDFRCHRAVIELKEQNGTVIAEVASKDEGGCASITVDSEGAHAPDTGLFKDFQERERLLKYHPLGLAIGRRGEIRLAEVFRDESAWREDAVAVMSARWGFFDAHEQTHLRLERATRVVPLDYTWRIGRACTSKERGDGKGGAGPLFFISHERWVA